MKKTSGVRKKKPHGSNLLFFSAAANGDRQSSGLQNRQRAFVLFLEDLVAGRILECSGDRQCLVLFRPVIAEFLVAGDLNSLRRRRIAERKPLPHFFWSLCEVIGGALRRISFFFFDGLFHKIKFLL